MNDTTAATGGTELTVHDDGFNSRIGIGHTWTPETTPEYSLAIASSRIVVRLLSVPSDSFLMSGTLYVGEEG